MFLSARNFIGALFAALPLLVTACGGGGSGTTTLESAALSGEVIEVDGQTVDRSGVLVELLETGQFAVTGTDGAFDFGDVPAGDLTLRFGRSSGNLRVARLESGDEEGEGEGQEGEGEGEGEEEEGEGEEGEDEEEGDDDEEGEGDEDEDDEEIEEEEGDDFDGEHIQRLKDVLPDDEIFVRCVMDGDEIKEIAVEHDERARARNNLGRCDESSDEDVEGSVEVERESDGDEFEIHIENLPPFEVVDILIRNPESDDDFTTVGTATADNEGNVEFELETDDGDILPLGVESVDALAGYALRIQRASNGECLLDGEIPALPDEVPDRDEREGRSGRSELDRVEDSPRAFAIGVIEMAIGEERQELFLLVGELEPEDVIDILVAGEGETLVSIGTFTANEAGRVELELGEDLPLGLESVVGLQGRRIEVHLDGEEGGRMLVGRFPELLRHDDDEEGEEEGDDEGEGEGEEDDEEGDDEEDGEERGRGAAELESEVDGAEGVVEIRRRPEIEQQRFTMEVGGLEPGTEIRFEIENPEGEGYVLIATVEVNEDGGARISTQDELELPLDVDDVAELIGLEVRVVTAGEEPELLLHGIVPELVED